MARPAGLEPPFIVVATQNLIGERGIDPVPVMLERGRQAAAAEATREFKRKMQPLLSECPGFVGAQAPTGPASVGKVVVEPGLALEAIPWLKRRFHVNENLALSHDRGLCVEVKPRARGRSSGRRGRVTFAKPEQFQFSFGERIPLSAVQTTPLPPERPGAPRCPASASAWPGDGLQGSGWAKKGGTPATPDWLLCGYFLSIVLEKSPTVTNRPKAHRLKSQSSEDHSVKPS
jgi:hypothetical protein